MRRSTAVAGFSAVSLALALVAVPTASSAQPAAGADPGQAAGTAVSGGAVVRAVAAPGAVPAASRKRLVVKGKVAKAGAAAQVLLIAADGTSVSAPLGSGGTFSLTVTNPTIRAALTPGKRGTGAALHLVSGGDYAGPFVLRVAKKKGFGRLSPTASGVIDLGKLTFLSPGYVSAKRALPEKTVDTRHTMRLVKGVPVGAGSQGATGSLRATALRSRSLVPMGEIPEDAAGLGADADTDGIPNVADVDMNGDEVLDAAQADTPMQTEGGGALSGDQVLENRPRAAIQFGKILNVDNFGSINSNITPGATWENVQGFLSANSMVETVVARGDINALLCSEGGNPDVPCDTARTLTRVTMDCRTQAYCQPGTTAIIRSSPQSGLDGKPLSDLINADGVIEMPLDTHMSQPGMIPAEQGFQLNFLPQLPAGSMDLVGDSFEYVFYDAAGTELARQVKVLTSSVAAVPEILSVAGTPVVRPVSMTQPRTLSPAEAAAVAITFTRPQRIDPAALDAPAPVLLDRGGMEYSVYAMTSGGPGSGSTFFWCRSEQVVPTAGGPLVTVTKPMQPPGRDKVLYDGAVDPPNGEVLGFTIDLAGCLANPASGSGGTYSPGETISLEIEGVDADFNRTRTQAYLRIQ